ncbi:MAG TPA: DNA ligase D [Steroidobacteraceae bacterium]|nr:DNA ligase D [Steroidobacteraceae bacterium]
MAKPALTVYRTKRDFTKTEEPSGEQRVAPSSRLRFVVQKHAARQLHYDVRLEWEGVFKSWAVARGPSLNPADKRLAVEVEDHPLDYGDFEGTIPKGEYGGGTVMLWDRGFWTPEGVKTTQEAFASGDLKFTLEGEKLKGSWVLVRMHGDRFGGKRTNWLLIKHRDASSTTGDGAAVLGEDRSVASGRTMQQIADGKGRRPKPFMLATTAPGKADAVWLGKGAEEREASAVESAPLESAATATATSPTAAKTAKAARAKPVTVKTVPKFIEPQLAKLAGRPPDLAGWGHEIKFDGYRAQLRVENGKAVMRTRTGLDWTDRFSAVAKDADAFADCIIDGEIVALDKHQLPNFGALQAALSAEKSDELVFYAFDLLFEGHEDLRTLALSERKARLEKFLGEQSPSSRIRYVSHLQSNAEAVLASACKIGLEGIISKKLDAPYSSGRSDRWLKAKCRAGQEVVLGGWTTEGGTVRSLLAGVHRDGRFVYAGRIGTGYGRDVAKMLLPKLTKLTRETSPFQGPSAPPKESNVRWLKPELVAEIEFEGWTDSGMIRQAAFKGLREDKDPNDVVAETSTMQQPTGKKAAARKTGAGPKKATPKTTQPKTTTPKKTASAPLASAPPASGQPTVMGVTISKPDKPLWPDAGDGKPVTKLDLARYYEQVGDWMLPHLAGRPCSLVRAPDGIGGQQFFQRHAMAGMSELFDFVKVRGDKAPYVQIDRVEALAAVAQFGALELHPWNCARNDPESAGRLVFDLDPAPDVKFDAVIAAAHDMRERLEKLGLVCFCKSTGGKGLHVVTPLTEGKKAVAWPVAKNFAHLVCAQMAQDSPRQYLDNMSKAKRSGRIFLDYLRNDRTATAVAVLSPRAREGAPVSMPLVWQDVKKGLNSQAFTVRSAPALLVKNKPWKEYAAGARSLADAIKHITRG